MTWKTWIEQKTEQEEKKWHSAWWSLSWGISLFLPSDWDLNLHHWLSSLVLWPLNCRSWNTSASIIRWVNSLWSVFCLLSFYLYIYISTSISVCAIDPISWGTLAHIGWIQDPWNFPNQFYIFPNILYETMKNLTNILNKMSIKYVKYFYSFSLQNDCKVWYISLDVFIYSVLILYFQSSY